MMVSEGVSPDQAEAELDAALARFLAEGPDPADLARIKTRLRAARIYARDSAHGRAYDYGQGLSIGLSVQDVNDWPDILAAVTAEDVAEAAREVLTSRATVTGWLLPETVQPKASAAAESRPAAKPAATLDRPTPRSDEVKG